LSNSLTIQNMVEALTIRGYQITMSESADEIMDVYDTVVNKRQGVYGEGFLENVTIPQFPTSYLLDLEYIITFPFINGGLFINHESLSKKHIIGTLNIFCSLVNIIPPDDPDRTELQRAYAVVPTMIIDFAKRSRVATAGYCLLKRCIRHALDTSVVDIRKATVKLFSINEEIGIVLEHKVRASMKTDIYDVKVAFTRHHIISCQCSCRCGSQNDDKVLCNYILPVIYQTS
jgi:hypothetical protein